MSNPEQDEGFIKIRRGLQEHIENGDLTPFDVGVYITIHFQANWSTGVWKGSAAKIVATYGGTTELWQVKKSLHRLKKIGFIKYRDGDGKRGNYPVLINKFEVTNGELKGQRLNADATVDYAHPVYDAGTVEERSSNGQVTVERPIQEVRSKTQDVLSHPLVAAPVQTGQPSAVGSDALKLARVMFYKFFEYPQDHEPTLNAFTKYAAKVLENHSYEQAKAALSFAKKSGFWFKALNEAEQPMAFFAKSIDTILEQRAERENRPKAQAKSPAEEAKAKVKKKEEQYEQPEHRYKNAANTGIEI